MGGEPEKLLTLQEAARRLSLPADDVEVMIRDGKLPSFRLAGNLLRLKLRDVETLRLKQRPGRPRASRGLERISDFFYFNDFYLLAFLILLTLLAIILTL